MNAYRKRIYCVTLAILAISAAVGAGDIRANSTGRAGAGAGSLKMLEAPTSVQNFADEAFAATWNRTDHPVASGQVARSWYWGPNPNSDALLEDYFEGSGHKRLVQYFDKSRMEINDPNGDPSDPFFVTNGLLTVELISGRMQVGNSAYQQRTPADIPLASDNDDPNAPTYISFQGVSNTTLSDHPAADKTGQPATATINKAGKVGNDPATANFPGTSLVHFEAITKHNIPKAIWDFLNQTGPVYNSATKKNVTARLSDPWFYTTGLPISEPYWAKVKIANQPNVDVMIQAFERRVVTYVPSGPAGYKVQMGNIGQHYYDWRYGAAPVVPTVVPGGPTVTPGSGTGHTADQFVGTWLSNGDGTGRASDNVVKLWITQTGTSLAIRWFGKCDVSLCDMGQKIVPYSGDPVSVTLGEYAFSMSLSGVPGQFQLSMKYHDDIGDEGLYFSPARHKYYGGLWLNDDAATTSVAKLSIVAGDPRVNLTVKWFAVCGSGLCEKEQKTQTYTAEPYKTTLNDDLFEISLDNLNGTKLKVIYKGEAVLHFHRVSLSSYDGTWRNVDPATNQIVRLVITTKLNPSTISVHMYGACNPTPCDNGTVTVPATIEPFTVKFPGHTFFITMDNAGGTRLKVLSINTVGPDFTNVLQKEP